MHQAWAHQVQPGLWRYPSIAALGKIITAYSTKTNLQTFWSTYLWEIFIRHSCPEFYQLERKRPRTRHKARKSKQERDDDDSDDASSAEDGQIPWEFAMVVKGIVQQVIAPRGAQRRIYDYMQTRRHVPASQIPGGGGGGGGGEAGGSR